MTRIVAIALIVLGLVGIAYGGITYVSDRNSVKLGDMKIQVEEKNTIPIPPIAGTVAVVAGLIMLSVAGRRSSGA